MRFWITAGKPSRRWFVSFLVLATLASAIVLFTGHPLLSRPAAGASLDIAEEHGAEQDETGETNREEEKALLMEDASVLSSVQAGRALPNGVDLTVLHGIALPPDSLFSLREHVPVHRLAEWSPAASLLAEAALKAGLEVAERHTGMVMPDGVKPGYESLLVGKNRDLKLYNDLPFDVWITVDTSRNLPEIRIVGHPPFGWKPPVITETVERFEPETMVLINFDEEKPYKPWWTSREGLLVKVYRTEDGERELLYKDFYAPLPEVTVYMKDEVVIETTTAR